MPPLQVSNKGRIRTYSGKVVTCSPDASGRAKKGHRKVTYLVARLVLAAFVGEPSDPSMDAGHKDGDKSKDWLANLEWQTHKQNVQECKSDPRTNKSQDKSKKRCRCRRGKTGGWDEYGSLTELATACGYKTTGAVSSIANGTRTHSSLQVEFVEEEEKEGEEWRSVPGMKCIRVSNMGRIRYRSGKISTGGLVGAYCVYQYSEDNTVVESPCVHEMVMRAFVGPRPDGHDIDHINSNTTDNRLSNLQYLTHEANMQKANIDHAKVGRTLGKPVLARRGEHVRRFDSVGHAAAALSKEVGDDVKQGTLNYHVSQRHEWYGYAWVYAQELEEADPDEEWRDLTDDVLRIAKKPAHTLTKRMRDCIDGRKRASANRKSARETLA